MAKIKIIELIKSLSSEELRILDKFVKSPIHNKHEKVIKLFSYIRKNIAKPSDRIYGEKLFKTVFPNEPIEMQRLHYVSSYLQKTVEEFLAWREWKKDSVEVGINLTKALRKHKIGNQFQKCLSITNERNLSQPLRDATYYHNRYRLLLEDFRYANLFGRTKNLNLQELADTQDIAYIVEKLRNASLLLSHQAVTKQEYDQGLLPYILVFLKNSDYLKIPSVTVYYHAYLSMSDQNNESSFLKLKTALFEQSTSFEIEELKGLYIIAINFCIKKLNTDNLNYRREVFEIYQAGLKYNIFFNNEEFSPWTYSNIVQVGLMLGEFGVIEKFIKKYKEYLPKKKMEAYYSYNYAWFFYQKKDYQNAMQLLLKTDYGGDILISCTAKTLLTRMYFELKELDSLESLLNSFKMFIRRKKMLAYHKDPYLKFIQFVQRISIPNYTDKYSMEILRQEIANSNVAAKEWLLEQVEKLGSDNNHSLN